MGTKSNQEFDINHWVLRIVAFIIDSIIISIVAYIILDLWLSTGGNFSYAGAYYWTLLFIVGIIELIYFTILDASWGATIGKRVLGLQVQMKDGKKVTFDKAFIRNISKIFGVLLLLDWIFGLLTPGADHRQKYFDRIAGTTVVKRSQGMVTLPSVAPPPPSAAPKQGP